ncbi:peptide-methionine (R)-S-oxide reductase [Hymenobacter gelipurpurascens]|uniref:peptide-methionine (R)-S-oxide reductase n=1 Tax=Hymenobacter gelipurpurascens TaxID=89968 RepID=A0A212T3N3_9BACT|nr:peptide-methionine (R)-S-oxide reductase MsrB [Hymenobacter gelipurpurascens]SNC60470.1 peptide-methionine (R)-S-oxide reductase [Hymenobacter gelipurpurascens]
MLRWFDILRFAHYSNPEPPRRLEQAEEAWAAQLTPAQFRVMRGKATEPPYRNAYCRTYESGIYACVGCGSWLFDSSTKYHAISGWPSFTQPYAKNAMKYSLDASHHMQRIEAQCNVCDAHLGHVFPDGPVPSGLRYCMNSESLLQVTSENS